MKRHENIRIWKFIHPPILAGIAWGSVVAYSSETSSNPPTTSDQPIDVVSSVTWDAGDRTVTMLEVTERTLPTPKIEADMAGETDRETSSPGPPNLTTKIPRTKNLFFSGTVYHSDLNPTKSLIRCYGGPENGTFEFWSSIDWRTVQHANLVMPDGTRLSLLLILSVVDEDQVRQNSPMAIRAATAIQAPISSSSHSTYTVISGSPGPFQTLALEALHKYYDENAPELHAALTERLELQELRRLEAMQEVASPPENLVIPFRILKPEELDNR